MTCLYFTVFYRITAVMSRERFGMTNIVTNAVVVVNCNKQVLPKTCESLRVSTFFVRFAFLF